MVVKKKCLDIDTSVERNSELISSIYALKLKYNINDEDLKEISSINEIYIPISIFSKKLSSLESIVKYLRENLELRNIDIAKLTKRDQRVVSTTYRVSLNKYSRNYENLSFKYSFPLSIISNKNYSILENVCNYLHNNLKLSLNEISVLLKRDYQTVWTVLRRYSEKTKITMNKLNQNNKQKKIRSANE